jgi:hypothetical protein
VGQPLVLPQGNAQDYVPKYVTVGGGDYISISINSLKHIIGYTNPSYPTQIELAASVAQCKHDNNATVVTSNTSGSANVANHHALGMMIEPSLAVASTHSIPFFSYKECPVSEQAMSYPPSYCHSP